MDVNSAMGFLQKTLPWIAAAATGNIPALVGLAANAVGNALGSPVDANTDAIANAVANADPAKLTALKQADDDVRLKAQALGFQHAEEMRRLDIAEEQIAVADVQDARKSNASNPSVFRLAVVILTTFAVVMGFVLYGVYQIIVGGITVKDVSTVAAVSGLVGSVVGYVAANAQTVVNFIFGGSLGSERKTDALTDSVKQAIAGATK